MNGSVRPSFRPPMSIGPSVTTLCLFCHHRILMKLSGVITNDRSEDHAKCQGHGMEGFWTVSPVWIHWWLRNDAKRSKQHRRGALLFFYVIRQISRSNGKISPILTRIERFWPVYQVWIHPWLWNNVQSLVKYRRGALFFSMSSTKFRVKTGQKISDFDPNSAFLDCSSSLNSSMALKRCTKLDEV